MNFAITNLNTNPALFGNIDVEVVLARQVHEQLESQAQYGNWFDERIKQGCLVRNEDYWEFSHTKPTSTGAVRVIEHFVTLDTAKHLAMLERTETGRKVRAYFIERDKQLRQLIMAPPQAEQDPAVLAEAAFNALQDEMEQASTEKEHLLSQMRVVDQKIQGLLDRLLTYERAIGRIRTCSTPEGLNYLRSCQPTPLPPGSTFQAKTENPNLPPMPGLTLKPN